MNRTETKATLLIGAALALSLCAMFWSPKGRVPAVENGLRVAIWNMEWFPAGGPEPQNAAVEGEKILAAGRVLRRAGVPDVFVAVEIRDEETCQALAGTLRDPAFQPVVCSDFLYDPTNRALQQIAIFSRYPAVRSGAEPYHASGFINPPRGFSWAVLDVDGAFVAVYGVHLKSNYIPEEAEHPDKLAVLNRLKREASARQVLAHAEALCEQGVDGTNVVAVVICGDFNTSPEDGRFAKEKTCSYLTEAGFQDAFAEVPLAERTTLPGNEIYPDAVFDRLYSRGLEAPAARLIVPQTPVSDHCPVYVVWPKPAASAVEAQPGAGGGGRELPEEERFEGLPPDALKKLEQLREAA